MIEFSLTTVNALYRATPQQNISGKPHMEGHLAWQWDHVRKGRMRIFSPTEAFDVLPGESVLSPPWLSHTFHHDEDSIASSIHFFWPEAPDVPPETLVHIGKDDLDADTLKLFFRYAPYSGEPERRNAAYAFHLLLWTLLENRFPKGHAPVTMKEKTRKLIEASNYAPLGVAELAATFNMSVNHFIRRFKAETGATPAKYVLECRLNRSQDLLQFSDMNITAIALSLGFADLYTFSKAFRRYTGLSPSAWKQRYPGQ